MSQGKKSSPFQPEDLAQAFEMVGRDWNGDNWSDVVRKFGETSAKAMQERFSEMEHAFFHTPPRHKVGSSVIHDSKTVRKDFLAAYPDAPQALVLSLANEYMWRFR